MEIFIKNHLTHMSKHIASQRTREKDYTALYKFYNFLV